MIDRIGTCSLCGGPVVVAAMAVHPVPYCARCGAHPVKSTLPVIEMEQPASYIEDTWESRRPFAHSRD